MTASFDFAPLINTLVEYGKSYGYKLATGDPRPGTSEYQQAQAEKQLKQSLQNLANQQVAAQARTLQDPTGMDAWRKVFPQLNAQQDAESRRRMAELEQSSDIGLRTFSGKADATAAAQNSIQQTMTAGDLARLGLENQGKLELLKTGLTGQQQALGTVAAAQERMYNRGLDDRSAFASRLAEQSQQDMMFKQDMYRQAMQQQVASNSGVRGFLKNILAPLAAVAGGAYALSRG